MKQNIDSNYNFLLTGVATNVGKVREANEDSMAIFETANMKVFVVCDGMGGHVGGQVASQTAITVIRDFLKNNITLDPREAIYNSIITANEAILSRTRQQPELTGMGSTCVMLIVTSDGKVYYGHVGDSRIYIVANRKITQLTEDHSVVYEMFKTGFIKTREEMERHPRRNEITNALGIQGMRPPTVCNTPIEPESGNCFLLCSDGLTGMVADEQIQRVISKHEIPIQQRAEKLVQMANENGGVDNITVELVEFAIGVPQIGSAGSKKAKNCKKSFLFVLFALVILGGSGWLLWPKMFARNNDNSDMMAKNKAVKSDSLLEYVTKPVEFRANEEVSKEILLFSDTIKIDSYSISTQANIEVIKIESNYITIKCGTEFPTDTVIVTCKTMSNQSCTIKIPFVQTLETSATGISISSISASDKSSVRRDETITLKAIPFEFNGNNPITIPLDEEIQTLLPTSTVKIKTNHPDHVKCDISITGITKEKAFVIQFMQSKYPDDKITFQVQKSPVEIYTFIIPVTVNVKEAEKSAEQTIEGDTAKNQVATSIEI